MNQPLHVETPLIESRAISLHAGRPVWLKLDALQPSGSYKLRGIGFACQEYARRGAKRFVSSSGGNAGLAVAYSGRMLSLPVLMVVPETTSELAKKLIQQEGAELIVHGASWQDADALARTMVTQTDVYIHPFDDPLLWQGHATMIDEIARTGVKPEAVVLSVGGGGLLCGVMEGLYRNQWQDIPVIAVETRGADSYAQSVAAGHRIELPAITSIATTLGARKVSETAFNWSQRHPIYPVVVSDKAAVDACLRFVADQRILVEPSCGASLAAVYQLVPEIEPFKSLLVVVCGGVAVSFEQLNKWMATL